MNVNSLITKDYRKKDDFAVQKNEPNSNPISEKPKMNVNLYVIKEYENEPAFRLEQNKPNQTQPVVSLSNLFQKGHLCCCHRNKAKQPQNGIAPILELVLFVRRYKYHIIPVKLVFFPFIYKDALSFNHKYLVFVPMFVQRRKPSGLQFKHPHCEIFRPILFGNQPSYFHIFCPLNLYRRFVDITTFCYFHYLSLHLRAGLVSRRPYSAKFPGEDL